MADIRNHRHHGAFGVFIAEPRGSVYLDPVTRCETVTGNQVIISNPILGEFREFVLLMHDGVRLLDKDNNLIIDPEPILIDPEEELEDPEDQGSRGFNYRAERFKNRLKDNRDISKVFSSRVHGDPSTPIFEAYPGDRTTVRFVLPADRARAHAFTMHGHSWKRSTEDINSLPVSIQGQNSVGSTGNFRLQYGAGGFLQKPGDYMYRSGNIRWDIELGLWGIMRVLDELSDCLAPLKKIDMCETLKQLEEIEMSESSESLEAKEINESSESLKKMELSESSSPLEKIEVEKEDCHDQSSSESESSV